MVYLILLSLFGILMPDGLATSSQGGLIQKNTLKPFQPGEELTYKVKYNMYFNLSVGEVDFKVKKQQQTKGNGDCFTIVAKGRTLGFYDPFFKVRDHYETCLNFKNMRPQFFMRDVNEGGYSKKESFVFDHEDQYVRDQDGKKYRIKHQTQDLLSVLYYARTFDFSNASPGDTASLNTFIGDTTYQVGFRYKGKENVETDMGEIRCRKIKPILVVGRIFDSKENMTLWVTDDQNKIPVKIESGLSVGAIQAELENYKNLKHPFMGGD